MSEDGVGRWGQEIVRNGVSHSRPKPEERIEWMVKRRELYSVRRCMVYGWEGVEVFREPCVELGPTE